MEEKNNIPQIRFKNFDENWEVKEFKEIFSNLPNNTLSRAELNYQTGLFKNVHYGDVLIKFGELLDVKNDRIPFISNDTLGNKFKLSKLQNGDIIMADTAEDESVGKCTELINVENENIVSGLHTIPVRPIQHFASKYLGYYLNSSSYHDQLLQLMQGIKVLSISKSALKNTILAYPPRKLEQSQIGTYFQNLDKLITLQQQKHDKLVTLKKAMLDKMFPKEGADVPEIRFKEFAGGWEDRELEDIAAEKYGGGTPRTSVEKYWNGFIPWIQSSDLIEGDVTKVYPKKFISESGLRHSSTKLIPQNSIAIITRVGVGKLAYIPFSYSTSQDFFSLSKLNIDAWFGVYAIYKKLNGELNVVQGTSIKGITKEELLSKRIYIPNNPNEQVQIGSYFQNLDKLTSLHQQEIQKLKNIKKACLEKMLA